MVMKKLLILGFGKTGHCVYEKLKDKYDVFVYDKKKINTLSNKYLSYEDLSTKLPLFDLTIRSPGISITSREYKLASLLSKNICSDVEFVSKKIKAKNVICITGSNGKTTVGRMIATLLSPRKVYFLGNVGEPLINKVDQIEENDYLILELSSFNLENISSLKSEVSIITSLSSNHLNSYDNKEMYFASKKRILFTDPKLLIIPKNDYFSDVNNKEYIEDLSYGFKNTLNRINQINLNIAIRVAKYFLVSDQEIQNNIKKIVIDPFRQEEIYSFGTLKFINDSKSTSVDSTNMCIKEYEGEEIILILQGIFKSESFDEFAFDKKMIVYSYGEMNKYKSDFVIHKFKSLEEILLDIKDKYKENKTILFSCGGTSLDLYKSYIERGEEFNYLVKKIWK